MKKYNTLKVIQTFSKIGKVFSQIVFICCIVGFCMSLVGIIFLAAGATAIKIGDVTLEYICAKEGVTVGTMYTAMAIVCVACAGEAVLSKFTQLYFKRELADGTPFTTDGADELFRLGIIALIMPVAIGIVCDIMYAIMSKAFVDVASLNFDFGSVVTGAVFILMSFVCRLGAEQATVAPLQPTEEKPAETEQNSDNE